MDWTEDPRAMMLFGWMDPPPRTPQVELHQLGQDIHISYGDRTRPDSNTDPRVIILFGWMDAPIRLLAKYAMNHRLWSPSSDIVIVQSRPAFIWSSEYTRDDILKPLANYLVSTIYHGVNRGILLHVLSNGGAFQLVTLSRVLHSIVKESKDVHHGHGTKLRLATIIDSAPGSGEYSSLLRTLTTNVKSPAVQAILTIPASMVYLTIRLRRTGQENLFTLLHTRLQMQELIPLADSHAPRLYIYSDTDTMVPSTSVERHISVLRTSTPSLDIKVEKFIGSSHVLHERQDPERYWNAIRAVWHRSSPIHAKL
ncbi:hypothetical protein C8R44DRAFT_66388 [Mycena epipterygia]|nr:hypothetical protein C8R44DRAFT_66388 [Mycena epipterygia]